MVFGRAVCTEHGKRVRSAMAQLCTAWLKPDLAYPGAGSSLAVKKGWFGLQLIRRPRIFATARPLGRAAAWLSRKAGSDFS